MTAQCTLDGQFAIAVSRAVTLPPLILDSMAGDQDVYENKLVADRDVEVQILQRTDPDLVLVLHHCWATPSANPQQQSQWPILVDRCLYAGDNYCTQLVPVGAASGLQFPSHHQRFIVKNFTFMESASQQEELRAAPSGHHQLGGCDTPPGLDEEKLLWMDVGPDAGNLACELSSGQLGLAPRSLPAPGGIWCDGSPGENGHLGSGQSQLPAGYKGGRLGADTAGRLHALQNDSSCGVWVSWAADGSRIVGASYAGCYVSEWDGGYLMVVGIEGIAAGGHRALREEKVLRCPRSLPGEDLMSYAECPNWWL
ncbi:lysine-specific demethylase 7A [Platysternon megacephalum]|uniref:Lysine-specific demethylase 7A n=1 Tax=Platysternon megacephalum TaxID=55544 RepID=A0A4D9E381_9SAUR|nr:lysine-specific demethylase 7A [Platysternon megacephalum]